MPHKKAGCYKVPCSPDSDKGFSWQALMAGSSHRKGVRGHRVDQEAREAGAVQAFPRAVPPGGTTPPFNTCHPVVKFPSHKSLGDKLDPNQGLEGGRERLGV